MTEINRARQVANLGAEHISVKDFGALGNGSADDRAAIQAAIDYADLGNGSVHFPVGTYLVGAKLTVARYVNLIGSGQRATFIKGTGDFDVLEYTYPADGIVREIVMADMTIDSSAGSGTGRGIYLNNPARIVFRNVRIANQQGKGLFAERNTNFDFLLSFYDCFFSNNGDWGTDIDNVNSACFYSCSWQGNVGELRFDGQYVNVYGGYVGGTLATSGGAVEIAGAAGSGGHASGGFWGVGFESNQSADAAIYLGSVNTVRGFSINNCFFTAPSGGTGNTSFIKAKLFKDITISGGYMIQSTAYVGIVTGIEFPTGSSVNTGVTIEHLLMELSNTAYTGTHDGSENAAVLTDSGEAWTTNVFASGTITNTTNAATATVVSNTGNTITGTLSGSEDWDVGDTYSVTLANPSVDIDNTGNTGYVIRSLNETSNVGHVLTTGKTTAGAVLGYDKLIYRDVTDRVTSGTGEDNLGSVTIAAGEFPVLGGLKIIVAGEKTNGSAEAKTIKVYVGAGVVSVITTSTTADAWRFELDMLNTSAIANRFSFVTYDGATVVHAYAVKGINTANSMEVRVTGEVAGTGTDVITQKMFRVEMM